jgi:hypothetical protein
MSVLVILGLLVLHFLPSFLGFLFLCFIGSLLAPNRDVGRKYSQPEKKPYRLPAPVKWMMHILVPAALAIGLLTPVVAIARHVDWNPVSLIAIALPISLILIIVLPNEWRAFTSRNQE